ncbi:MAG: YjgP/YjgQ family permease [Candidatus Kapabacteria bacterium]|nr:YjgP/YjgQ family permease [Candidatus Kapabacteria bacterium]
MTIIDRYVLRQFLATLGFAVLALVVIFIVVDLLESLDEFLDQQAPLDVILRYYVYFIPNTLRLMLPVSMLLAALFSVGRLSNNNEVTAMRSGGQSLLRLMLPILAVALCVSAAQLYFNGWVVPVANAKKFAIERTYLGKSQAGVALYRLFFRDIPTRNVAIESYDAEAHIGRNVTIEVFADTGRPRIVERIDAPLMEWDSAGATWRLPSAIRRRFQGDTVTFERMADINAPFTIRHDQLVRLQRNAAEMTFDEVRDLIETLRKGGKNTRVQEIGYQSEWSLPFANFIVVLIAVPFASVRRRGGMAAQIAAGMGISFVYIAFTLVGQAWGAASSLPTAAVAWSANVVFFVIGIVNLVRTKS